VITIDLIRITMILKEDLKEDLQNTVTPYEMLN